MTDPRFRELANRWHRDAKACRALAETYSGDLELTTQYSSEGRAFGQAARELERVIKEVDQ